ncbi:alpha-tocopherol transfer protein-like isoform X3 [Thrips palmi]|uniref:Alpha-tocopherol transfer protein-like isoform X3 n=1 Tax=Thrips palmi TaxID=161013 RepID=A0A6P8XUJ4_THRPL|nr:alpha-tocopherol transfer protein-like isoform X3 [Thrips palmi]
MGGSRRAVEEAVDEESAEEQDLFEDAVDSGTDGIEQVFRKMAAEARAWSLDGELARNKDITAADVRGLRSWCRENKVLPDIGVVFRSYFCLLPKKTPEGFRVMVQALRNPDPTHFVYSSSSKAQFLTMDAAVLAEPTAEGYVCIFDMKGVQLSHMWAWGIRLPRKIFKYLQEGLPLRMQRIHFVNTTTLMDRIMKMLRPFINKELTSIFQFHTSEEEAGLHEFIPKDCLPADYGGFLPPLEKLQGYTDTFLAEVDSLLDPQHTEALAGKG